MEDVCGHLHSEMTRNGVLVAAHHRCMVGYALLFLIFSLMAMY